MLNQTVAYEVVNYLPLIYDIIGPEKYKLLLYKWGGIDGAWHSYKACIKETGTRLTLKAVEELEQECISAIYRRLYEVMACPGCGSDLRKNGVRQVKTGIQASFAYIGDNGKTTRSANHNFQELKIGDNPKRMRFCAQCNMKLDDVEKFAFIFSKHLNTNNCIEYYKTFLHKDKTIPVEMELVAKKNDRYRPEYLDRFNPEEMPGGEGYNTLEEAAQHARPRP